MAITNHRRISCLKLRGVCWTIAVLAASVIPTTAVETTRSSVVIRDTVSSVSRDALIRRLQAITGWSDLVFDPAGFLTIKKTKFQGGSASARELVMRAVSGETLIALEAVNSRADVVFCRVDSAYWPRVNKTQPVTYVVLIDFSDFKYVSGDKEARAAFDVGWAVLHEIEHVVNDSEDTIASDAGGECEANINRMRTELGLPVRASYYFTLLPLKTDLALISKFVRLPFEATGPGSDKRKRYWLIWDAALVGGLTTPGQTASLQSSFRSRN